MKVSIIDIGTQSLKHYIFTVENGNKTVDHYTRYSDANLGEGGGSHLEKEAIQRCLAILNECLALNTKEHVERLQILGTEILRTTANAKEFAGEVRRISDHDIEIISQDQEALYLYKGFVDIVPEHLNFGAMNIGGGSTEVVVGDKNHLVNFKKFPFGVKFLKKTFSVDGVMNWDEMDKYLAKEIEIKQKVKQVFVTGVLDFITTVGPHFGFKFEGNDIPRHPFKVSLDMYKGFLKILRKTPVEELKKLYLKDPGFSEGFAIGQSVYVAIAQALDAHTIIPSNNDLTDGVVHQLIQ